MLIIKGGEESLLVLLNKQLQMFNLGKEEFEQISGVLGTVLSDLEYCFSFSTNKYYKEADNVLFNPIHSSQYCIFLYKLSRSLHLENLQSDVAAKVYLLNKMLHSCDLYHDVELPQVFFLDHPLGAVMGKASYGNFFSFRQGCTVGNNRGIFPVIGENVKMWSNSKLLGNCKVGDNVIISANTYIKDTDIPSNTIVFGSSPNLVFKPNSSANIRS